MEKKIGDVLARTFREICNESNKKAKKEFSIIQAEEMGKIEQLLKRVDNDSFNFINALREYLKLEEET